MRGCALALACWTIYGREEFHRGDIGHLKMILLELYWLGDIDPKDRASNGKEIKN